MAFRIRNLGWKAGCVGLALIASTQTGRLQAAPQDETDKVVQASVESSAIVESLIDDASEDGSISTEERRLIMGQARRRLNGADVAEIEARLAALPATPATFGSVTKNTAIGSIADEAKAADNGNACCDEPGCGGLWDNMYVFGAADGWSGILDDTDGNNFGLRLGMNMGIPVDECRGIGAQFGLSYNVYNFHGRNDEEPSAIEDQIYLTLGLFKRADLCNACPDRVSWGIVYDHVITDNTSENSWEFGVGQFRGQVGYALDYSNEVGLMLALASSEADGSNTSDIRGLDQGSLYWSHHWCWGADTKLWLGIAEDPGEFVFGYRGEVPISNCVSLFGTAQYILPSTSGGSTEFPEEFWNVSVGASYYPGGNAASKSVAGRRWMPLLPVADNGSFALEVHPGGI